MTKPKDPNGSDFKEQMNDLVQVVGERAGDLEAELRAHHKTVTRFVRDNPITSVLGALAVGYMLASVAHKRVIYVEKT